MRESMSYDLLIVGGGPSGLACAIRAAQLQHQSNQLIKICVLEKGAEIGAHLLSGALLEPRALNELLPDWKNLNAPINTPCQKDKFLFLSKTKSFRLPTPPAMQNKGNYIISLGHFCRWLAKQAENLGVEIFPGFAAKAMLYDENNQAIGVHAGEAGINKQGQKTERYEPGVNILAKHTILAEGCRGSLSKQVIEKYALAKNSNPQIYGLGFKEIWELEPSQHQAGLAIHTLGYPLDKNTYGGGFIYHGDNHLLSLGFVLGLDYQNPYLDPYEVFQCFKAHPSIQKTLKNAKRVSYGARAISEGGYQSIPELNFPGGLLIGDTAGFLNVAKIKGIHTAMKSGMLAAENIFSKHFTQTIKTSWIGQELYKVRNIRGYFRFGLWPALCLAGLDTYLFRGNAPWTLQHTFDHEHLRLKTDYKPIDYPKHDGITTFDKMDSVMLTNTHHEEDQPCHLRLKDPNKAIDINFNLYASPEIRYCPAGVYEIIESDAQKPYLQINASNCIHCKACDIKDPTQNIDWITPEGGGGPNYSGM